MHKILGVEGGGSLLGVLETHQGASVAEGTVRVETLGAEKGPYWRAL